MTDADKPKFAEAMLAMSEVFDKEMSEAAVALYFATLKHLTIEEFQRSVMQLLAKSKWMPRPSDILDAAVGTAEDRALRVWDSVKQAMHDIGAYRGVAIEDPALANTVRSMGGWVTLCRNSEPEHFVRKLFVENYVRFQGDEHSGSKYFGGDCTNQTYTPIGPRVKRMEISDGR